MTTPVPSITPVPDFPALSDRATYNAKAFAWAQHMDNVYPAEMQALAVNTHGNAVEANDDALATAADRVQTGLDRAAAALSATTADTKAGEAFASATAAAQSTIDAAALLDQFDDRYLGIKAADPTLDNDGNALAAGAIYVNSVSGFLRAYNGSGWVQGISAISGVSSVNGMMGDVLVASTSLSGAATIYVGQAIAYTITDFDSFSTYSVAVSAGSVTRTDSAISFTAPAVAGNVTLTVTTNGVARAITLAVLAAAVATPSITSPTAAATGVIETPTITTSAFATIGQADTHLNSDWELWSGPGRTGTKLASSYADAVNKTSWTVSAGVMLVGTTYYPAVLHRGTALGASAWATSSFTTATSFNSYIATPAATPANFGDAFEGGFYMGLFWNQIAQASNSKALATGSQAFTVPDMTGAPMVYAGQTLEVRSRANPDNKFVGTVTGAIGTTLTLNVTSIGGSGTFADWSVMSRFRSIEAPKASGEHAGIALKNTNDAFPTACQTLTEGWAATLAMVAAGTSTVYPAAHWARALVIGGKSDWHIPARDVRELAWRNGKPTTDANYATADRSVAATPSYMNLGSYGDTAVTHGLNKNSSPTGAAYTTSVPGQTAATAFRVGGAEAFEYGAASYWSASEYSATYAWYQAWHSSAPGYQDGNFKSTAYRVRAVRRSII